jgi:hypothetical protein
MILTFREIVESALNSMGVELNASSLILSLFGLMLLDDLFFVRKVLFDNSFNYYGYSFRMT